MPYHFYPFSKFVFCHIVFISMLPSRLQNHLLVLVGHFGFRWTRQILPLGSTLNRFEKPLTIMNINRGWVEMVDGCWSCRRNPIHNQMNTTLDPWSVELWSPIHHISSPELWQICDYYCHKLISHWGFEGTSGSQIVWIQVLGERWDFSHSTHRSK